MREMLSHQEPDQLPEQHAPAAQFLCDVGTWLWRLQRDLDRAATPELDCALRPARRDLEYLWSVLATFGLEVLDHVGEPVPSTGATSYRIVGYEETDEAPGSRILETVLPEVRIHQALAQQSEVIASRRPARAADGGRQDRASNGTDTREEG